MARAVNFRTPRRQVSARTAATVQRLADANFSLRTDQAQGLLTVLDALIDLGERRSVALEQAEAFRGVQLGGTSGLPRLS